MAGIVYGNVEALVMYTHPTSLEEFEKIYRKEYKEEIDSCDRWIRWCKERNDAYGLNFHQGLRSAMVFNNVKMEQLLRVLKQESPNKRIKPLCEHL